jgi:hypothetical protein
MAVRTFDEMNIVAACRTYESRVHLLYVEPAMRHLRMTGFARSKRTLIVAGMTGEATQSFVNAHRSAIVAGSHLRTPVICSSRRVGLGLQVTVAQPAFVGTDFSRAEDRLRVEEAQARAACAFVRADRRRWQAKVGSRGRRRRCAEGFD